MSEVKGISVIIPVYNSENTVVNTLESICKQKDSTLLKEIIVVNDGSTDDSANLIKEYSTNSPIKIILINKANGGVSSARNEGIKAAKEEWLAFCDADDTWYPDKIEKQVRIIKQYDVDLIGGNHTEYPLHIFTKRITKLHKANVKELCIKMFPQTSTILVKKHRCVENGYFDENQHYAEDGNLFLKIAANGNYYYMPDQITVFDNGRRGFGVSGLSANMRGMYEGNLKNLKDLSALGYISKSFALVMKAFYWLKYFRRVLIVRLTK